MQVKPATPTPGAATRPPVKAWVKPSPKKFNASISTNDATFDITGVTTVGVSVSPDDADGNPSRATLSLDNFVSSDETVLTVAPDPNELSGNSAIITFVGMGSATLTATATATEPDGTTTEQIQGVGTVTLTSAAPPIAASLAFNYGVPQ